jgi:hypothetical protein
LSGVGSVGSEALGGDGLFCHGLYSLQD